MKDNSIASILGNREFHEPEEVQKIKRFVRKKFKAEVSVAVQDKQIVIYAASAPLAGNLQMSIYQLKEHLKTDKRLIIRIGQIS